MAASPPTTQPPSLRAIGPGVAGLLSLAAVVSVGLVPLLGVLLGVVAALPLVHTVASGRPSFMAWGWVAVALAGGVLVLRWPWLVGVCVAYLLLAVWPAVAVETWLRRSWGTGRFMAIVTLVTLAVTTTVLSAVFYPGTPTDGLSALLHRLTADSSSILGAFGGPGQGVNELFERMLRTTAYLAPSLVASYVFSAALWLRPRLALLGLPRGQEPFAEYSSEEWLPVGFALGGLAWVFLNEPGKWLGANLLVTVLGLYFIHGLAIIHFYLGPQVSRNRWVRLGVAVLALSLPVALLLSVLGLADGFFRLRRGGEPEEGSQE
jgi:uncharacterized protein YybS (DUF2232 family)